MKKVEEQGSLNGFSPVSSTPVFWKSRKRSASSAKNLDSAVDDSTADKAMEKQEDSSMEEKQLESNNFSVLSEKRKALFEPLEPDREIDGLNEQLEEDARVLEHLQLQLLEERSKRTDVERQNTMLQDQITMLMNMLHENEPEEDDGPEEP
ncbi:hypothetical protein Adt_45655 [Abeliophyllum distichum]|uniref:Uncharacterized protein n=1 Tax=Abeliophyllum distichum TaxID=126358 RepID=A0ABD1PED2_9LAMI